MEPASLEGGDALPKVELNWASIHALVQEVPKQFRDPGFSNSGNQIGRVVTAADPAHELTQVKNWQLSLEEIIDQLVGTHGGSFSRSINNYSTIVGRFEVTKKNVDSLRLKLKESMKRLVGGNDVNDNPKHPVNVWKQTLILKELAVKLSNLEQLTKVPTQVRELIKVGEYELAVEKIVECVQKINGSEYRCVHSALRDLSREIGATTELIRDTIKKEIGKLLFACGLPCRKSRKGERARGYENFANCGFLVQSSSDVNEKTLATENPVTEKLTKLITCLTRLGDEQRVFNSLHASVCSELWILTHEQLLFCQRNVRVIRVESNSGNNVTDAQNAPDEIEATLDASLFEEDAAVGDSGAPLRALECITTHVCSVTETVLGNLQTLDALLAHEDDLKISFATAGRDALQSSIQCTLQSLIASPDTMVGGFDTHSLTQASGTTDSWWQLKPNGATTRAGEENKIDPSANVRRPFVFGAEKHAGFDEKGYRGLGTEPRHGGTSGFDLDNSVRTVQVTARALREEFGWASDESIFDFQSVADLLRSIENAE